MCEHKYFCQFAQQINSLQVHVKNKFEISLGLYKIPTNEKRYTQDCAPLSVSWEVVQVIF